MKTANQVCIIKGADNRTELMIDLHDKYLRDNETSIMFAYDEGALPSEKSIICALNPAKFSFEDVCTTFIPRLETGAKFYNGKIFIYTNKKESENKELIKFLKNYNFPVFTNKAGEEQTRRYFYIICE